MVPVDESPASVPLFPPPVRGLPRVELPFPGAIGYLAQAPNHQVLFMSFSQTVDVPQHTHAAQWSIVLAGNIEVTLDGVSSVYGPGDRYFIPAGVSHSARIHLGYSDITVFDQKDRYVAKTEAPRTAK